jgi:hypothetical protein
MKLLQTTCNIDCKNQAIGASGWRMALAPFVLGIWR